MSQELKVLEEKIGYTFNNFSLLKQAMIHSSYANEKHLPKYECNERLEFLGDAVLELVASEFLVYENRKMPEGELTKTRASIVCEPALAFCAKELELGAYLLLGKGEDATGGSKCNPGIVIQGEVSQPVAAPANARVLETGVNEEIGNYLILDLGDEYSLICGQLKEVQAVPGEYLEKGQVMGYVAEPTKYYTLEGPNVFVELRKGEQAMDPLDFLE